MTARERAERLVWIERTEAGGVVRIGTLQDPPLYVYQGRLFVDEICERVRTIIEVEIAEALRTRTESPA